MPNSTIQKFLCGISVASLLTLGISSAANANPSKAQAQSEKQTQQPTKSVAGKVAAIGNGGTSFTLEVSGGGSDKDTAKNMDFVVDKNTQVKGQVKQGTAVTVEYQAMANGQLLAVSIMAQA